MKKGFTLVELLAVIVILAVILAIAIPGISGVVKSTTKNAFESDLKMILKAIDYKMLEDNSFDLSAINESTINSLLSLDNSNYKTLTVKKIDNTVHLTVVGQNKWDGLTGSSTKIVSNVEDTVLAFVRGANTPILSTGMTPIKWNGTTWVDTTSTDEAWYNYDTTNKIWANARTADGSMWVWIPRYIYKIQSANWHTNTVGTIDIQFSKGVDDNWNKGVTGNISLDQTSNASNNTWTNHPAFTFGDTELTGIWVAKFEASSSNPGAAGGGGNVTNLKVKSVPNVASWRNIIVNNIFTVTKSMETDNTYGWGTTGNGIDTHMMKNTEWGATSYLAQSLYGKNAEIWINNSSTLTTGCAGSSVSAVPYAGCENTYDTANGMQASTTGNIYGVYDMSGGAWEYMASYVNNGHTNLSLGSNVINADLKYRNVYAMGSTDSEAQNYIPAINYKGDVVYETSSSGSLWNGTWYRDASNMPKVECPWFLRGASYVNGGGAGIFYIYGFSGGGNINNSFRTVLLVESGL